MVFEELLFENSSLIKLKIFRSLTKRPSGHYSFQEISEDTQLSYSQITRGLMEIEDDLTNSDSFIPPFIRPNVGVITSGVLLSADQYVELLLKESLPYQFLLATLLYPQMDLETFCQQNFISRSTLSRKMKNMNRFIASYGLKINYQRFCIEGAEDKVRLFYYYFIYLCHHNLSWPLLITKKEAEDQVKKFANFFPKHGLYVSQIMLTVFSGICITRIKQHQFVSHNERLDFLFVANPYYDLNRFKHEYDLSEEAAEEEARFIYFICNFFPFYEDPKDPSITKSLATFQAIENPVCQLGDLIVDFVTESLQLHLPFDLYRLLLANLYNSLLAFYIFEGPFPNFISFIIPQGEHNLVEHEIQDKLYLFLEDTTKLPAFHHFKGAILPLAKIIRQILFPLMLRSSEQNRLRVAVAAEPNYLLNFNLLNFLRELSFVDCFYFQENKKYDLVISTLTALPTDVPIYHLTRNPNSRDLPNLYQVLLQTFMQKNGL